jgi:hypothetical protein
MYKIIGVDGREYGPVSSEVLQRWAAEGRVNGQTPAQTEGATGWKPLATFPEFAGLSAPPPIQRTPPTLPATGPVPLKNSPMAVAGFVCSLLGLVCCGPLFSILGLVFSLIGLGEIKRNPQQFTGGSLAVAGIILAGLGLVLFFFFLVGGLWRGLFPGLLHHHHRIFL